MRKSVTFLIASLLFVSTMKAQQKKSWDFTLWSAETKTNLAADATNWQAQNKTEGDTSTDIVGYNNVSTMGGTWGLYANGKVIAETEGLYFYENSAKHWQINWSADVNYLWINGKNSTDKVSPGNVRCGEKVTLIYSSHSGSQARGFNCLIGSDASTTVDPDEGYSNTIASLEETKCVWTIPEVEGADSVQVWFKTTSGAHIFKIIIGEGDGTGDLASAGFIYNSGEGTDDDNTIYTAIQQPLTTSYNIYPYQVGDLSSIGADSLRNLKTVIISSTVEGDVNKAVIDSLRLYVPVVNFSALYAAGAAVDNSASTLLTVTDADNSVFDNLTLTDDSILDLGYNPPLLPTSAADGATVIAKTAEGSPAIFTTGTRNAFINIPYGATETFNQLALNAFNAAAATKTEITPASSPVISLTYGDKVTTAAISSATKNAVIYYTTDGADPTENSWVYSEALTFTESVALKAFAKAPGYYDSEITAMTVDVYSQCENVEGVIENSEGESVMTLTVPDGVTAYYNIVGVNQITQSSVYSGPVSITRPLTVYYFAVSETTVPSEVAALTAAPVGVDVYADTLLHTTWSESGVPTGDIVKKYSFANDSTTIVPLTNGWTLVSRGQRINNQTTNVTLTVGEGSYGPWTALNADPSATAYAMSLLVTNANGDSCSAAMITQEKYQGPFQVVANVCGQQKTGTSETFAVAVSADSVSWQVIDTVTTKAFKGYAHIPFTYTGDEEVYVKIYSANDYTISANRKLMFFDVYIFSKGYPDAIVTIDKGRRPGGDDAIYDMSGRRVNTASKGVYIRNGRKFVVR